MQYATQATTITPFRLDVPEEEIHDLHARLDRVRWPDKETVEDWSQGVPQAEIRRLVDHWRRDYDWRRCETALNSLPQFKTVLDGLGIYFLHVRSSNEDALPLILTHGWPGSILEFQKVIGPLSEPQNFGGDAADAFHLVIPALPGYSFSDKPTGTGWGLDKIASNWDALMKRLGYGEYVAQGGDWGSAVTRTLARHKPAGLKAIHTNLPVVMPPPPYENLSVVMYWLPNCGASSARLYWEDFEGSFFVNEPVPVPCGYSVFPKDIYKAPRSWAERCTPQLIHWNELKRGGHFAALEQPYIFAGELRTCFRQMR